MRPFTSNFMAMENSSVASLRHGADGVWNEELINRLFRNVDAQSILQIPLYRSVTEDRQVWHYSIFGTYSV